MRGGSMVGGGEVRGERSGPLRVPAQTQEPERDHDGGWVAIVKNLS